MEASRRLTRSSLKRKVDASCSSLHSNLSSDPDSACESKKTTSSGKKRVKRKKHPSLEAKSHSNKLKPPEITDEDSLDQKPLGKVFATRTQVEYDNNNFSKIPKDSETEQNAVKVEPCEIANNERQIRPDEKSSSESLQQAVNGLMEDMETSKVQYPVPNASSMKSTVSEDAITPVSRGKNPVSIEGIVAIPVESTKCIFCEAVFKTANELKEHMRIVHAKDARKKCKSTLPQEVKTEKAPMPLPR